MTEPLSVIAIDGPAGAGKTTVGRLVAKELGFTFLETGAMYRAVALIAKRHGLTPEQGEETARIAREYSITLRTDPARGTQVFLGKEEVTEQIREPWVAEWASALSAFPQVRKLLVHKQKEIAEKGNVVLEGRDTTTVICPSARLKIFLTASLKTRARRIYEQMRSEKSSTDKEKRNAPEVTQQEIEQEVQKRDERDSTREDSPLRKAEDAIEINTDDLTIPQVVQKIIALWHNCQPQAENPERNPLKEKGRD